MPEVKLYQCNTCEVWTATPYPSGPSEIKCERCAVTEYKKLPLATVKIVKSEFR